MQQKSDWLREQPWRGLQFLDRVDELLCACLLCLLPSAWVTKSFAAV
ncbi:MAG: hypothetical protein ETSY1_45495 [Candidatus Entotheonella factor]|uniref:Uncharacterized protein n=1 Tax=Entotheonella factor TaxID=1429438 RepID=W4L1X8_ENTF1|nr:MAG: hypothetical protein ETSY1_45495 [Candidatus Entotheonella factor]